MRHILTIFVMFGLFAYAMPVSAQEAAEAESADAFLAAQEPEEEQAAAVSEEAPVAEAEPLSVPEASTLERRVALAKEMHEFRSTREQIDGAVHQVALRFPQGDRQGFITSMMAALNYAAIERISVDAMAETFTVKELEAMVAYYSKPEAKSITQKTPLWAEKVQPEITRMIDKAMMRVRTGAPR
jgi:hypothetical protein